MWHVAAVRATRKKQQQTATDCIIFNTEPYQKLSSLTKSASRLDTHQITEDMTAMQSSGTTSI